MSMRLGSHESLEYAHQHPDPTSSDTPPSTPSDHNSHHRRPSTKRRTRPGTGTGTGTGDENDNDSRHHHHHRSSAGRFLTRMMERDDRDSKKMSTLLLLTNERLEGETIRANEAERKMSELIRRFRDVLHGRDLALQESARVKEELGLYKAQLDSAQREIFRAQEVIQQVAKEKNDAEEDAARARTKARKLQEEKMMMIAREEGRRQGFQEGLSRGRRIGFEEGRSTGFGGDGPQRIDDYREDGEDVDDEPIEIRRSRSPENRRTQRTPVVAPRPLRAPPAGNRSRSNTYDTALHAPTLPVPTVVTPISVPSMSHAPRSPIARIPISVPVPDPSRSPESIRPIPIRNSIPSPTPHSAHKVLRDGFIPEVDGNSFMNIPPPHELSAPVPSPHGSEPSLPPLPRSPSERDGPTVRSRDFAYPQGGEPESGRGHGVPRHRTTSTGSRGSTTISQYDLVSPPRGPHRHEGSSRYGTQSPRSVTNMLHAAVEGPRGENYYDRDRRSRTPQMNSGVRERNDEEVSPTQRIVDDWRSANPLDPRAVTPAAPGYNNSSQSPNHLQSPRVSGGSTRPREMPVQPPSAPQVQAQSQQDTSRPRSPLNWLFKRRNRGHTDSSASVPEILIEPPSGSPSDTSVATVAHPHLLSPEDAVREMPLPGDDELNEFVDAHPNLPPPSNHNKPIILPDNQLPFGFVPLSGPTTVMMASRSQTPRLGEQYATAMLSTGLSYPESHSRPSTSFEPARASANTFASPASRRRQLSLGSASSPAPLQRPISLFSDDA